jgi:hypothetical protein
MNCLGNFRGKIPKTGQIRPIYGYRRAPEAFFFPDALYQGHKIE